MLKRLELVGFKSFADKTAFEFGHGITAIVGPNGSGKSNVVDAVRWILGEQSAKSLRGGEMTDVIFNGSASRRSFGMAEVTMTLDNSRKQFATESDELQITRRVYRSGEGEYLINHQICRLKDIKDILLGSGAGTDAYCIIAQGKVDVLLQASTKERRSIFEEAAGISRFRVKKIETLRKLERVDLNVQRLRDIIDEVEKQLRSVKLQAAKAQRYQEYSGRLKSLRVGLGLQDYHEISQKLSEVQTALDGMRGNLDQQSGQVSAWENEHQQLEESLANLQQEIQGLEATIADAREEITAQETTLGHEHELTSELEKELIRLRQRVNQLSSHQSGLAQNLRQVQQEFHDAQSESETQRQTVEDLEANLRQTEDELTQLDEKLQTGKAQHLEQMRQTARLQNDAVTYKTQIDNLQREINRLKQQTEQATESLASLDTEMRQLSEAETSIQTKLSQAKELLKAETLEGERLRRTRDETSEALSNLRQHRSGLKSRCEVLEGLERSHEGLGTGVGELLDLLDSDEASVWKQAVIGMVADCLEVRRDYAPLIDLALGDLSQHFVVRDVDKVIEAVADRRQPFSGRISFLQLRGNEDHGVQELSVALVQDFKNSEKLGIVTRADAVIHCTDAELANLPKQLLGRTLIVRDLSSAQQVLKETGDYRLITLKGEVLEPDGSLTVGTHHADTGILSRKSELREVREEMADLDERIAESESSLSELREQIAISDSKKQNYQQEAQVLSEQSADLRSRLEMQRNRREGLHEEVSLNMDETQRAEQEIQSLESSWKKAQDQAGQAEANVQALQQWIEQAEAKIRQLENNRQTQRQESTTQKVSLAKSEERVSGLRANYQQLQMDLQQRQQEWHQGTENLQSCKQRINEGGLRMLHASSSLAHWHVVKELAERSLSECTRRREDEKQQRAQLSAKIQSVRSQWQAQQEQFHTHELQANNLKHKLDSLAERLREDYELEMANLYQQAFAAGLWNAITSEEDAAEDNVEAVEVVAENDEQVSAKTPVESNGELVAVTEFPWTIPPDSKAANEEIEDLRKKLHRLGSVNLDALKELAELELRATTLNTQFDDLTAAKRSLEEIIQKIDIDSKRLFAEAFETIRAHFQELFRKLFGGGMADIVLEDETDILESGIEIIARPPGKELRSISLMSGGEKTLTAVALLLSIFRSKPSPFCILDEVDAALDEANIGRFADVLHEFLDQSHFIIITHSKRTMAAADVIYGVTMQESGISKRVSVRFEDWPDDHSPQNGVPVAAESNGR